MAYCTEGHESTATDYCDICGAPVNGQSPTATPQTALCPNCGTPSEGRFCENCGHDSALPTPPEPNYSEHTCSPEVTEINLPASGASGSTGASGFSGAGESGSPGGGDGFSGTRGSGQGVWVATISADPAHYARMRAQKGPDLERVDFPDYYPDRRIALVGPNILIGKRSVSQGVHPDIDLSVAPADIAVSRSHAILHLDAEGVTVTDLGSTNGTCLNDSPEPIAPKTPVRLLPGDRIHVGGWTTITVTIESE
ncbi:FHA domain-containing protein [Nocardia sp. CDC153]|uniref:FHA domain-containing protein n=1 Tax=Nocardia sp. CDC153 TaxID=3112167 RepID=UPI002DB627E2|nr:FHA domain-containing protein [Nocardia sp. CDC153]MEC3957570.1 FHA domain-containing protein [Nocardia sp. CDC153]